MYRTYEGRSPPYNCNTKYTSPLRVFDNFNSKAKTSPAFNFAKIKSVKLKVDRFLPNGVFPGGMAPGMSMASAAAIFGWVSFFFFTFIILWSKCGIGMKMFALSNAFGGMLAFMNPESTVKFSEGFTIDPKGTAFNTLIATWIACQKKASKKEHRKSIYIYV